jgi:hypothetical protein
MHIIPYIHVYKHIHISEEDTQNLVLEFKEEGILLPL